MIIKFIKVDDVSVVRVGSVITCFDPRMLSSDLKSLLSDCNWTRTQNHLVLKRTLNHLAKLTK